jgi:uncharacterized protein (TIGR00369 family)
VQLPIVLSESELQAILVEAFPATPQLVESVTERGVTLRLKMDSTHSRPGGTVSGPSIMSLADCAAWLAIMSRIGPVVLAVTTSLHIDFLRRPQLSDLLCEAEILKLGTRLAIVAVRVHNESMNELVASAQVTYSIPPKVS